MWKINIFCIIGEPLQWVKYRVWSVQAIQGKLAQFYVSVFVCIGVFKSRFSQLKSVDPRQGCLPVVDILWQQCLQHLLWQRRNVLSWCHLIEVEQNQGILESRHELKCVWPINDPYLPKQLSLTWLNLNHVSRSLCWCYELPYLWLYVTIMKKSPFGHFF